MKKKCVIIGAGDFFPGTFFAKMAEENKRDEYFIIVADGGWKYACAALILPDLIIGDFDSVTKEELEKIRSSNIETIELPEKKDETDLLAAIYYGQKIGLDEFHIFAGIGSRPDHSYANIQCLTYLAKKDARGYLYYPDSIATVFKNGVLEFSKEKCGILSIFSISELSMGVTLKGLKYPLTDYTMLSSYPIGVSNEFSGADSSVEVKDGMLLVFYSI